MQKHVNLPSDEDAETLGNDAAGWRGRGTHIHAHACTQEHTYTCTHARQTPIPSLGFKTPQENMETISGKKTSKHKHAHLIQDIYGFHTHKYKHVYDNSI